MKGSHILLALFICVAKLGAQETVTNMPRVVVVGNGEANFVGFTNTFVAQRDDDSAELQFNILVDDLMNAFPYWLDGETIAEGPRYTNSYAIGVHTLHAGVNAYQRLRFIHVPFEVVSPLDAMRRLRADLELTGVRENISDLRPVLRASERALERRDWRMAARRLQRFDERLSEYIDASTEHGAVLVERWSRAARAIENSLRPLRRGPLNPPVGSFPGPD
jgi:hypothetical protein